MGCKHVPLKVCRYCGSEYSGKRSNVCWGCIDKEPLLPRFREARDYIREWCGLERMGDV